MDMNNLSIVRQSFANAVFNHKIHEVSAETSENKSLIVKIINIIMVSIVLIILFFQSIYSTKIFLSYYASAISIAEVVFLIIQLNFNFESSMNSHKNSALKYMNLRDKYRSLIVDIINETIDSESIRNKRDHLQQEYQIISEYALQTNNKEYQTTQIKLNKKGVVQGEEFTWSDEEIDRFLPDSLKLMKIIKQKSKE